MEKERQEEAHNFQNDNQDSSFAWILPISFFLHKILIYLPISLMTQKNYANKNFTII